MLPALLRRETPRSCVLHPMTGDQLLTLPLVLCIRLRLEGLTFGLVLDPKEPDVWRFRFAPLAELHVSDNGEWAWRGVAGRARRLVVPLVEETELWLASSRAAEAPAVRPSSPQTIHQGVRPPADLRSAPLRSASR